VGGSIGSVNSTNPYVYANNLPNMLVDPSGGDCESALIDGFFAIVGDIGTAQVIYDAVVGSILAAAAFPPEAATVLAGVAAYLLLYADAREILHVVTFSPFQDVFTTHKLKAGILEGVICEIFCIAIDFCTWSRVVSRSFFRWVSCEFPPSY